MKSYLSYSLDDALRYKASTGGFCKEFIRFVLENKIVSKAIVTVLGENTESLVAKTVVTNDIERILSTKSNTIYDKTDPLSVLSELTSDESYIFVGLPCHVLPVKMYCKRRNIKIFTISLFCNHTSNNKFAKTVLAKANLTEDDVKHFEYRGTGWPGFVSIITNIDEEIKIDFPESWANYADNHLDMLPKCKKCTKLVSPEADICVGDAWLQRVMAKDKRGTCIVLSMNSYADTLMKYCAEKKYISLEYLPSTEFDNYHKNIIEYKIKRQEKL